MRKIRVKDEIERDALIDAMLHSSYCFCDNAENCMLEMHETMTRETACKACILTNIKFEYYMLYFNSNQKIMEESPRGHRGVDARSQEVTRGTRANRITITDANGRPVWDTTSNDINITTPGNISFGTRATNNMMNHWNITREALRANDLRIISDDRPIWSATSGISLSDRGNNDGD